MILVTGGAGFIGAGLVKALVRNGERVRILDDYSRGSWRRLKGFEEVEDFDCDIRNMDGVDSAMDDVDEVWHLAAVNGTANFYKEPERVLSVGVWGMMNVIDVCRERGVKKLYFVSSSEVYQTPPTIPTDETAPMSIPDAHNPRYSYAGSKIISELLLLHSKWIEHGVILRPHNIYGPDMGDGHVIPQIAVRLMQEGGITFQDKAPDASWTGPRPFWGGSETRAFCYIDDCIDAFLAIRKGGKHQGIYNVGTQEEVSIVDLARRIAKRRGVEITIQGEKPDDGGTIRRCPDISKLRALGFEPKVSLDEGLTKTLEWYWRQ